MQMLSDSFFAIWENWKFSICCPCDVVTELLYFFVLFPFFLLSFSFFSKKKPRKRKDRDNLEPCPTVRYVEGKGFPYANQGNIFSKEFQRISFIVYQITRDFTEKTVYVFRSRNNLISKSFYPFFHFRFLGTDLVPVEAEAFHDIGSREGSRHVLHTIG